MLKSLSMQRGRRLKGRHLRQSRGAPRVSRAPMAMSRCFINDEARRHCHRRPKRCCLNSLPITSQARNGGRAITTCGPISPKTSGSMDFSNPSAQTRRRKSAKVVRCRITSTAHHGAFTNAFCLATRDYSVTGQTVSRIPAVNRLGLLPLSPFVGDRRYDRVATCNAPGHGVCQFPFMVVANT